MNHPLSRLVDISVDGDVSEYVQVAAAATYDLSKINDAMKAQSRLNLKRGWCSAMSGKNYTLHQVMCAVFDFPFFSVGRADMCVISVGPGMNVDADEVLKQLRSMWSLAGNQMNEHSWRYHNSIRDGHAVGWQQVHAMRPKQLDIRGLCHILQVDAITSLIPRDRMLAALSALETGKVLELNKFLVRR